MNEKPFGSNGTWKDEWIWEITIADSNGEGSEDAIYYGKAVSNKPNKEIPWIELKTIHPLKEIIEMCKYHMKS